MLVPDSTYHANRERLPGRVFYAFAIEWRDNLMIVVQLPKGRILTLERPETVNTLMRAWLLT